MVVKILEGAGFVRDKTYRQTSFLRPPRVTYAVYNDSYTRRGSDDMNLITEHDVTIELYQYEPDPDAEKRIEDQFDLQGIEYEKQERYKIEEEQLYQVIYEFSYISKGGN